MKAITLFSGRVALPFLLLCASATPSLASQLWGIVVGNSTSIQLNQIDVATGTVSPTTTIGSGLAFTAVQDLASDPVREPTVLWAIRNSINGNELISVDPFQKQLLSFTIVNVSGSIRTLAIDPSSGTLYGTAGNSLYRIAKDTGNATFIGTGTASIDKALGFDTAGNLYGVSTNTLVAIDKLSGAMNVTAPFNLDRMEDIAARPEDGVMYGLGYPNYDLFKINLADATLAKVGASLSRPSGLAFTALPSASGDYNADLVVDAADYLVWRKRVGLTYGPSDYDTWRSHYGQTTGSGGAATNIPEPASIVLFIAALAISAMQRLKRRTAHA